MMRKHHIINPHRWPRQYSEDISSGIAVCYSLRKVVPTYSGNCVKVRRDSDNTTQDIGWVTDIYGNSILDTYSLLTFVGSGNGYIHTWYDQSGSSIDVIQIENVSYQPQIVSSGSLILLNNKPSIYFDGINDGLKTQITYPISTVLGSNYENSTIVVQNNEGNGTETSTTVCIVYNNAERYNMHLSFGGIVYYDAGTDYTRRITVNVSDINALPTSWYLNQKMIFCYSNGLSGYIRVNGFCGFTKSISGLPNLAHGNYLCVGYWLEVGSPIRRYFHKGKIQEIIIYKNDISSDKYGIEGNVRYFYSIY